MNADKEKERQDRNCGLLQKINVSYKVKASGKELETSLSEDARRILTKACLEPMQPLNILYSSLQIHSTKAARCVDELQAKALIRIHRVCRDGKGGTPKVIEITTEGFTELGKMGFSPNPIYYSGRGSFIHRLYSVWVAHWARGRGFSSEFEKELVEKIFDVLLQDKRGKVIGVEICLTGSKEYNLQQAMKALAVQGIDGLWLCFEEKELLKKVKVELRTVLECGNRVEIKPISEFYPW